MRERENLKKEKNQKNKEPAVLTREVSTIIPQRSKVRNTQDHKDAKRARSGTPERHHDSLPPADKMKISYQLTTKYSTLKVSQGMVKGALSWHRITTQVVYKVIR